MEKQTLNDCEIKLIIDAINELKESGELNIPEETTIEDIVGSLVRNQIQFLVRRVAELEKENEKLKKQVQKYKFEAMCMERDGLGGSS